VVVGITVRLHRSSLGRVTVLTDGFVHCLSIRLILNIPQHITNKNRSSKTTIVTLSGHMEFAQ